MAIQRKGQKKVFNEMIITHLREIQNSNTFPTITKNHLTQLRCQEVLNLESPDTVTEQEDASK